MAEEKDTREDFKFPKVDRTANFQEVPFYQEERMDAVYLKNKRIFVEHTIIGADAATAANYGTFWIAPVKCTVVNVWEVHETAGSDGGAVTLDVEKLDGTTAPGSGDSVLASTIDLKATANTVQTATITTTLADRNLAKGDRLALVDTGTLTSVANVTVVIELKHDF